MEGETSSASASMEAIIPNDLLEKIFSFLPIASIIRAGSVCKRWLQTAQSANHDFLSNNAQKPWYFMFTHSKAISGHAYDPSSKKWHNFEFPFLDKPNWFISSSSGLVCFMDYENRNRILVCNPITKDWKQLQQPPNGSSPDYSALALSVNPRALTYTIAVVKSKQLSEDFLLWDLSIQIYESERRHWVGSANEVLEGWRGGNESVICNGILYCLVYSFPGSNERRHSLIRYDLGSWSLKGSMIPAPCRLTCGRLMNLRDRVVLVGGIGWHDVIKGIGVWELWEEGWREVGRMPHKFFRGFGELDDVFSSSGAEDLIFIQSYGGPALLLFDVRQRLWRWALRCPASKRFALQLFAGFCFHPSLQIRS